MSIPNLPVNFKDDILAASNAKRKYQQTYNSDGSVSFEDVTAYQQQGSDFGAQQVNETNGAVNNIYAERIVDLDELELVTEPGFFVDALAVKELNSKLQDTGWVNCSLGYGMSVLGERTPQVRRIGNVVHMRGRVATSTKWTQHDSIVTIPEGFRPSQDEAFIQSSMGTYRYRIEVMQAGNVVANAITNDQYGNAETKDGYWFALNCTWLLE